jgi:iron complex outermembrane receptor protein
MYHGHRSKQRRSSFKSMLFSVGVLLAMTSSAFSEVVIGGVVTDADAGVPLPGANVALNNGLNGTITDHDGSFSLAVKGLPVTLLVSYIGYERQEIEVREVRRLEVGLREIELTTEDLVVVGSRFEPRTVITSPVPVDNVTTSELEATGQLTVDKMLTYAVPAFNSTQQTVSDATAHFDPADLRGL